MVAWSPGTVMVIAEREQTLANKHVVAKVNARVAFAKE
jgi:hypothetical protein